ncbi:hypothetical protein PRIPAC_78707, partial [Pristionchus pacificus]
NIRNMRSEMLGSALVLLSIFTSLTDACLSMKPTTPGIPAVPCKTCAANLLTITTTGAGAKAFDGDSIVRTTSCATRSLTCKGVQATIELSDETGVLGTIDDGGTDTSTLALTCNGAATAWTYIGTKITKVECSAVPACRSCAAGLITISTSGAGAKPMDDDQTVYDSGCAVRTFTCDGAMANIEAST